MQVFTDKVFVKTDTQKNKLKFQNVTFSIKLKYMQINRNFNNYQKKRTRVNAHTLKEKISTLDKEFFSHSVQISMLIFKEIKWGGSSINKGTLSRKSLFKLGSVIYLRWNKLYKVTFKA